MNAPRRLLALLPAALAAAASACAKIPLQQPSGEPGRYVFEVEYQNQAWGPEWKGIYVDRSGDVWAYDRSGARPTGTELEDQSGADLAAKYASNRHLVRHLDAGEVTGRAALIDAAAHGQVREGRQGCADAGGTAFYAYQYDPATDRYHHVLLYEYGTEPKANDAAQAAALAEWLRGMDARFDDPNCGP